MSAQRLTKKDWLYVAQGLYLLTFKHPWTAQHHPDRARIVELVSLAKKRSRGWKVKPKTARRK